MQRLIPTHKAGYEDRATTNFSFRFSSFSCLCPITRVNLKSLRALELHYVAAVLI